MGLKEWRNKADGQGLHVWILAPWILFKEGVKSIFGKRGSQGMQQDTFDKGNEQEEKKAKSVDGSESFEAAGVLQHPY